MGQIPKPSPVWKVQFVEHERGWGSSVLSEEFYDEEGEARTRAETYNREHNNQRAVPDCYIKAHCEKV